VMKDVIATNTVEAAPSPNSRPTPLSDPFAAN